MAWAGGRGEWGVGSGAWGVGRGEFNWIDSFPSTQDIPIIAFLRTGSDDEPQIPLIFTRRTPVPEEEQKITKLTFPTD